MLLQIFGSLPVPLKMMIYKCRHQLWRDALVNKLDDVVLVRKSRIEGNELRSTICESFEADDGKGVTCGMTVSASQSQSEYNAYRNAENRSVELMSCGLLVSTRWTWPPNAA